MIDKSEVLHNIKTGSDTDLYLSRINTDKASADFTKIKSRDKSYRFPYLTRTTGNSLKPTTEYIQSSELRHGGSESAPRPGNTSVEGSIDLELSPVTFDDNLCSLFQSEWRSWKNDTDSVTNLDKIPCEDGKFLTRACKEGETEGTYDEENYNNNEAFKPRRLLNDGVTGHEDGLLIVPKGSVVNELAFGKKNIEYLIVKKYGGTEGEDLYHIFKRLTVSTLDLSAEIGQIVTGSLGFLGDSSSDILDTAEAKEYLGGATSAKFEDGVTTGESFIDNLPEKATDTDQFTAREGDLWINGKNITFGQTLTLNIDKNMEHKYSLFVKNAISKTSQKKAITSNLDTYLVPDAKVLYNLANNNKTFEILFAFEDKGYMNDSFKDEDKPEFIYLFQIFNAKAEDKDLSASGESDYDMSIPLRSFGEKLCRVFKIALPKILDSEAFEVVAEGETATGAPNAVAFTPNILLSQGEIPLYDADENPNGLKISVKVDNTEQEFTPVVGYEVDDGAGSSKIVDANGDEVANANVILDLVNEGGNSDNYGHITVLTGVAQGAAEKNVEVTASWNGKDCVSYFTVPASA